MILAIVALFSSVVIIFIGAYLMTINALLRKRIISTFLSFCVGFFILTLGLFIHFFYGWFRIIKSMTTLFNT